MSDKNKHLDFDLEFLDQENPTTPKTEKKLSAAAVEKKKNDRRFYTILFSAIGGIALIFVLSSSSVDTEGASERDGDSVTVGDYSCSLYHAGKADEIEPSPVTESRLKNEEQELQDLADELENTTVNTYSQYSVDSYNSLVDEYEQRREEYNDAVDRFNAQVTRYNNYLEDNCSQY